MSTNELGRALPVNADGEWYRKAAKKKLKELRVKEAGAKLADAQLAVARGEGFASWRKLGEALKASMARRVSKGEVEEFVRAIEGKDVRRVREMLKGNGALANAEREGATVLGMAIEGHRTEIVKELLKSGARTETTYAKSSHSALSWALTVGAMDAAKEILKAGVEPDLFCAAGLGDVKRVRGFFGERRVPMEGASRTGSTRFGADGKRLVSPLTPPTGAAEQASDALYIACRNGQEKVVEFLLTREVDVNFRAYMGGAALHWAYFSASERVQEMVRKAGADEGMRDFVFGCTPRAFGICVQASWGMMTLLKRSIRNDAGLVNLMEGRGAALHEAARSGQVGIVRTLLKAGADGRVKDREGKSAVEVAREAGHEEVARVIEKAVGEGKG